MNACQWPNTEKARFYGKTNTSCPLTDYNFFLWKFSHPAPLPTLSRHTDFLANVDIHISGHVLDRKVLSG